MHPILYLTGYFVIPKVQLIADQVVLKMVSCTSTSTAVKNLVKENTVYQLINSAPASELKDAMKSADLLPSALELCEFAGGQHELLLSTDTFSRTNFLMFPFYKNMCIQLSVIQKRACALYNIKREELARFIIYDVAQGILHMHNQDIVHLDISTENVLTNEYWRCVITDFGEARCADDIGSGVFAKDIKRKHSYVDPKARWWMQAELDNPSITPCVDAPNHCYRDIVELKQVDAWCLGVLLFILLLRSDPPAFTAKHFCDGGSTANDFHANTPSSHRSLFYWIDNKNKILNYIVRKWSKFSLESVNLLTELLQSDPTGRPSMAQVLCHDWFHEMDKSCEAREKVFTTYSQATQPTDTTTFMNSKKRTSEAVESGKSF